MRLGPGDGIRLEIKDEPQLSAQLIYVGPDGSAMLPLLGIVAVGNRPFAAVQAELRSAYAKQIADAQILATPLLRIPVLGEVRLPGLQMVEPGESIEVVLARAGGLLPTANRKRIALLRAGTVVRWRSDGGATPQAPIALQSGDQITVARRGWVSDNTPVLVGALASVAAAAVTTLIVR